MIDYSVERALKVNDDVFNIGDNIVLFFNDNYILRCTLRYITWLDEYTVGLMTDKGTHSIQDINMILKDN